MPNIIQVLEQETMWYGQDGYPYYLDEMDQDHRWNVLLMLKRRAKQLAKQRLWLDERQSLGSRTRTPADNQRLLEAERAIEADPLVWLRSRPFMIALEKAIRDHGTIDGEVIDVHEIEPTRRELES